ncbi:MAG: complex I subunit 5 family protein [Promethearchaeota archaeon]
MMFQAESIINVYIFPIIIPLITSIIVLIIGMRWKSKKLLGSISIISSIFVIYFSFTNLIESQNSPILLDFNTGGNIFVIDPLSTIISLISSILGLVVTLYSIGYLKEERTTEYFFLLLLMISALNGVAYSSDLVTIFVFIEFLVITTCILVAYNRNKNSIEASFKYIIMAAIGAACILFGLSYIYVLSGTTDLTQLGNTLNGQPSTTYYLLLILFVFGFGVKAAIFPVHTWLPDAHSEAPSGVSAMLSGIVIGTEMFALLKILTSIFYSGTSLPFDFTTMVFLLIIGGLTVVIPNLTALVQEDIKRLLAFSSVYNMGMILISIAVGIPLAIAAAVFHLLNHGISKATMFICAGSFIKEANTREIEKLVGIGTKMKVTGMIFTIGALYMAGFPPFGMFWSKLYIIQATIISEQQVGFFGIIMAILIVTNTVISIGYYYGVLIKKIVLVPESEISEDIRKVSEKSKTIMASQIILLALMLLISVLAIFIFDIICNCTDSFLTIYN